jgi:hypothetical protein
MLHTEQEKINNYMDVVKKYRSNRKVGTMKLVLIMIGVNVVGAAEVMGNRFEKLVREAKQRSDEKIRERWMIKDIRA